MKGYKPLKDIERQRVMVTAVRREAVNMTNFSSHRSTKSWRETVRNQDLKEVERWEKLVLCSRPFSFNLTAVRP